MSQKIQAKFRVDRNNFILDVDLTLPEHGVSALFGHSGSGKTTCLRAMAGLERTKDGYFAIGNEIWQDEAKGRFIPPHQRAIGVVFQEASLFPHLSVRDNMSFGQKRAPATERRFVLPEIAELLGINHLLERSPNKLSGGERQRVAIDRALLSAPQILLMDEPLAALDYKRKLEILPYLERLRSELSLPIIYVSHSPDEVARLADHLVLLDQGKVLAAICHGPWMLCSTNALKGKKATCFFAIKDDVINAGANYVDAEVVRDGQVITSRKPDDLPAFMKTFMAALAEAKR